MQNFQCNDVRDRLFGTMALVDWGGGKPPVPDYRKSNWQVAIEVLRLYLDNSETAPLHEAPIEWPRQLSKIFNVTYGAPAILDSIAERYHPIDVPWRFLYTQEPYKHKRYMDLFDGRDVRLRCEAYRARLQSLSTVNLNFEDDSRDTWRGVKLRDVMSMDDENPEAGDSHMRYLYCAANDPSPDFDRQMVEILDHMHHVFGYAPPGTRPHDWLLTCNGTLLCDGNPPMVVVTNAHGYGGIYAMIGQASKVRGYKDDISPLLDWTNFDSHWQAEDLFHFEYMYGEQPVLTLRAKVFGTQDRVGRPAHGFKTLFYKPKRSASNLDPDHGGFAPD
ncbi:hypothetical protein BKA58DRAFT_381318 [Alternaria rosae]|uniref:uncharacterized protein n=1 Tax=Alternaria rosae TaxID=1187941 RepID=UPI001E8EEF53|nr:uncharacterized protein BKA58DRAFT_381318 [Alternaria rosae]KAH6876266.1 hypothetical protein BKA58DRAFT_381318 [Alternaria rosae]